METLKLFINEMHSLHPTTETEKIINIFDKLNSRKITKRVYDFLVPIKDFIYNKNETIFDIPQYILPEIDLSANWKEFSKESKDRIFIYLQLLFLTSSASCDVENFNPYLGIDGGNVSINDICKEIKSNPTFSGYKDGPNMSSLVTNILSSMGYDVDKLMKGLSDGMKELTDDNIKDASNEIIGKLGISDPNTIGLFDKLFTSVAKQIKDTKLDESGVDGFVDIFSKITNDVFEKVIKPDIDAGKVNTKEIIKAQQNMYNTLKTDLKDNNLPNPFEMLGSMGMNMNKPTDKPADKPTDKPTDKPADKPMNKLADKPTDKPTDKHHKSKHHKHKRK